MRMKNTYVQKMKRMTAGFVLPKVLQNKMFIILIED